MIQIFLADGRTGWDGRTDQPKVVEEVLADLKMENLKEISSSCWAYPFPWVHLEKFFLATKNKFTI